MDDALTIARRVVLDVLSMRAPDGGDGPVYLRAVDPEHLPAERLRMVQQLGKFVPRNATRDDVERVAQTLAPMVRFTN